MDGITYKKVDLADSEVRLEIKADSSRLNESENKAFEKLKGGVKVKGFRPGKAPADKIKASLGADLFNETLNILIPEATMAVLDKEELNPLAEVEYDLKSFTGNDGIEFTATFVVYPEIKLGDFKKIKVKAEEHEISAEEIDKVITRLLPEDKKDIDLEKLTKEDIEAIAIDDAKDLESLKKKVKDRMQDLNKSRAEEERTSKIIEEAIELSYITVPKKLIDKEAHALVHEQEHRIQDLGLDFENFLKSQGKTKEELEKEKRSEADKKIKVEMLLNEIAKEHEVIPTAEDIVKEIESIEDKEVRKSYDTVNGRRYIATTLIQRNGLKKLLEIVK